MRIIALLFASLLVTPAFAQEMLTQRSISIVTGSSGEIARLEPGGLIRGPFTIKNDKGEVIFAIKKGVIVEVKATPDTLCIDEHDNIKTGFGGHC